MRGHRLHSVPKVGGGTFVADGCTILWNSSANHTEDLFPSAMNNLIVQKQKTERLEPQKKPSETTVFLVLHKKGSLEAVILILPYETGCRRARMEAGQRASEHPHKPFAGKERASAQKSDPELSIRFDNAVPVQ